MSKNFSFQNKMVFAIIIITVRTRFNWIQKSYTNIILFHTHTANLFEFTIIFVLHILLSYCGVYFFGSNI